MSPRRQLNHLAARKALLQARIAARRLQCQLHAAELEPPLRAADRALAAWQRISPLLKAVGVPAGILLGRQLEKRWGGKFARFARFAPVVLQGVQVFMRAREQSRAR